MTIKMKVLVPSRGRPENIQRLIDAFGETWAHAELVVVVDNDDPTVEQYKAIDGITLHVDDRLRLGGTLNKWAPILAEECDIIGFMGDDHVPRTNEWDFVIEGHCRRNSVIYGNDLLQGENLATAVFMDSNIVKKLGFFVLPGQIHLFMDNFWMTLGRELGTLTYLPHVIIEHMHRDNGKSESDQTYVEANSPENWSNDEAVYRRWMASDMASDIRKVLS